MNFKIIGTAIIISGLVIALGIVLFERKERNTEEFQGYIEGKMVLVGAEQSGRIEKLTVAEGDFVDKNALLFSLDNELAKARLSETAAAVAQAEAQLANLNSQQQRPEQIAVLVASKGKAEAAYDLAKQEFRRIERLVQKNVASKERFDQVRAELLQAKAALEEIEHQIEVGRLPARKELIEAAQASVEVAREAKHQAKIQLQKRKVISPVSGRVEEIYFRKGEVVTVGQPVLSLLPPANLKVLFFVNESVRTHFTTGQKVGITCDGCKDNLFGKISFISQRAEFTPPIIYGPKERTKLVFRIEADLQDAALKLSPGQPVSVAPVVLILQR